MNNVKGGPIGVGQGWGNRERRYKGIKWRTDNSNALEGGPAEFGGRGGLRTGIGIPQFFADFFQKKSGAPQAEKLMKGENITRWRNTQPESKGK